MKHIIIIFILGMALLMQMSCESKEAPQSLTPELMTYFFKSGLFKEDIELEKYS